MNLPGSLREINPVIDRIARGGAAEQGPERELAIGLGLVTPQGALTDAGRAYDLPSVPEGPAALVMNEARRAAAERLLRSPLPLPTSLRRLLQAVVQRSERLVSPASLNWPEVLLRPYLSYLEDLGLLVAVGPFVEPTDRGRQTAALHDAAQPLYPSDPDIPDPLPEPAGSPDPQSARYRYLLARQVSLSLLYLRGRREWYRLFPLLDGPLSALKPAYSEWLGRFVAAQPSARRTWSSRQVELFANQTPIPPWFATWTRVLLEAEPAEVLEALSRSPKLLDGPAILEPALLNREGALIARALQWTADHHRVLHYELARNRLELDGVRLPVWSEMHRRLEKAGLLVSTQSPVRLLSPVQLSLPAEALWPFGGPELLAAALLEGHAINLSVHPRQAMRL
ncbi:MAG: hypothetical protein ACM3XM_20030 [Mycobacterium leprae]